MRLLCEEFDEHHRLAWLETDKPENVRFYIGLGFEVAEEGRCSRRTFGSCGVKRTVGAGTTSRWPAAP